MAWKQFGASKTVTIAFAVTFRVFGAIDVAGLSPTLTVPAPICYTQNAAKTPTCAPFLEFLWIRAKPLG